MQADESQADDVVREPTPAAAASVVHGLDAGWLPDPAAPPLPAPRAAPSASAMVECIPVPAFLCKGDRILAANAPATHLVGCELAADTARSFSRLFALSHRLRIEGALRLEPGACTRLPAATLLTDAGGARRVELRLAGVALDRQRLTLVTAMATSVPLLEPVPTSTSHPLVAARLQTLTPREHEILDLVTLGATSKAIAQRLGISCRTVETHRANLLRKLDLRRQGSGPRAVRR